MLFKRFYVLISKEERKSEFLSPGFCLLDSKAEQKALYFSGIEGLNETTTTQNQLYKIRETEL